MTHTPGPLRFHAQGSGFQFSTGKVTQKDHKLIGFISGVTKWRRGEAEANAHRIVAAWNACEGMSTEALEQGVVADLLAALQVISLDPKIQRWITQNDPKAMNQVREAIARTKR